MSAGSQDDRDGPKQSARGGLPQSEYVQSLERGLAVIRAFDEDHQRMTVAEVARAVGLTRGAARRFLLTLQQLGYVSVSERYYSLRPAVLELGYSFLSAQPWWRQAQRVAQRLAIEFQEPCAVAVLDGVSVVYVCYASAHKFSVFNRAVGTRLPAFATAVGRALLTGLSSSQLDQVLDGSHIQQLTPFTLTEPSRIAEAVAKARGEGYALVDQELEIGLASFGVPIRDRVGEISAAISMSFRASTFAPSGIKERYLESLREASLEIAESITP